MGVDNSSKLIVGWNIDYNKFYAYMKENNIESCGENYQCMCGPECWGENWKHDFVIKTCSPYYDCGYGGDNLYVCLTDEECLSGLEITELLKNTELITKAKKFAISVGAEDKDLIITSEPHIW